jgi:alpha-1,6-mannosyltransferase
MTAGHPIARSGIGLLTLLALAALFYRVPALATNRVACQLFGFLLAGGMLANYLSGYRALRARPDSSGPCRAIVGFAVGFGLLALLIVPVYDIDLCSYVNIGWQQVGYGVNPYVRSLNETPNWRTDPMFRPYWEYTPSPYGFLFSWLARVLCRAGGGDYTLTIFLFRAVGAVVFALTGWVVWRGCPVLRRPRPELALYLLLWNPLLLTNFIVQGHNDLLMALFTAVGLCGAAAGGWLIVVPALVAAVMVKYIAAPLIPLAVLYLARRHGWRKAAASSAAGALVGLACSLPYVGDLWQFQPGRTLTTLSEVHNSLPAMLYFPFEVCAQLFPAIAPHGPWVMTVIKLVGWLGFLAFAAVLGWRRLTGGRYDAAELVRDAVLVQFVVVCLVSAKFYAWYLGMFFPLALWLPRGDWLRRSTVAVSCAQLLSLTFVDQAHFLNVLVMLVVPLIWVRQTSRETLTAVPSEALAPESVDAATRHPDDGRAGRRLAA